MIRCESAFSSSFVEVPNSQKVIYNVVSNQFQWVTPLGTPLHRECPPSDSLFRDWLWLHRDRLDTIRPLTVNGRIVSRRSLCSHSQSRKRESEGGHSLWRGVPRILDTCKQEGGGSKILQNLGKSFMDDPSESFHKVKHTLKGESGFRKCVRWWHGGRFSATITLEYIKIHYQLHHLRWQIAWLSQ